MIIDCISDLHGFFPTLPGGDLLIVAGDLTSKHTIQEYDKFKTWFQSQPYEKKILVAGNHDTFLDGNESRFTPDSWFFYLEDREIALDGIRIYGTPWTPIFEGVNPRCKAFMLTEKELEIKFASIPEGIDILVSHGPPWMILDECAQGEHIQSVGSKALRTAVERAQPRYNVFGHIHENGGQECLLKWQMSDKPDCWCYNVSYVDEWYRPRKSANIRRIEICT